MCSIDSIKNWFMFQQLSFSIIGVFKVILIVILLLLPSLFCNIGFANNSVNLRLVGQWNSTYGIFKDIEILEIDDIEGNIETGMKYAFCATTLGMVIFDINDPNNPYMISFTPIPGCNDIAIAESASNNGDLYAYVAANERGQGRLKIFKVTDPNNVLSTCQRHTPGNAMGVAVVAEGSYAYVADGQKGLTIFDINDITSPIPKLPFVGHFPGFAQGVVIEDDYVYVAGSILKILDISNRTSPKIVGSTGAHIFKGGDWSLTIAGDYAYAAYWMSDLEGGWDKDLKIIDIRNKKCPTIIGRYPNLAGDVAIEGNYMYTYVADRGLKIFDISDKRLPKEVDPAGSSDIPGIAGRVAIKDNYAYVVDQHLRIFDINNKSDPDMLGTGDIPGAPKDMVIAGDYAYVADGNTGLLIIHLSNQNGPTCIGIYEPDPNGPGFVMGVAIEGDYAYVISRSDPNAVRQSSLQVIDISDPNTVVVGNLDIDGSPRDIAIESGYAYITFLRNESIEEIPNPEIIDCSNITQNNGFNFAMGLQIIDIQNPDSPEEVRTVILERIRRPGINRIRGNVAIKGDYVYVADRHLRIIDVSNKSDPKCDPNIDGDSYIPSFAVDFALADDYVYETFLYDATYLINAPDPNNALEFLTEELNLKEVPMLGKIPYCSDLNCSDLIKNAKQNNERVWMRILRIIDICNPENPEIVSTKILDCVKCGDSSDAFTDIAIKDEYAYVVGLNALLRIIDISNPEDPIPQIDPSIFPEKASQNAQNVAIANDYVYVAGKPNILWKLKIDLGESLKGNLILVAGGNIDYESPYWHATQSLANLVFKTFIDNDYENYEIFYHNPVFVQDIDNDGITNQLVVDYPMPSRDKLLKESFQRCSDSNTGPLYIYLIGHGGEDRFQIVPGQVITASELKGSIDRFQERTNRQVVVIIESAASGTFIDDLIDDNVTVITSTDDGASYIKPDFSDTNTISCHSTLTEIPSDYNSFTKAFIDALDPHLNPNNIPEDPNTRINSLLKEAFMHARCQLRQWALEGQPFSDQAPQMALPGNVYTSLSFWDGNKSVDHLFIDQNVPQNLTIIAEDISGSLYYLPDLQAPDILFYSSDPNILDPEKPEDIEMYIYQNDIPWYNISPRKNGIFTLMSYPDPNEDPDCLLSAKLTIEVSDPNYLAGKGKMAVIIAGYKGSGDYLWDSTNYIGNHAYKILRAMGYTKGEIYYYNPYLIQDIDENGEYDEIQGYPHLDVLDPDAPNSPFEKISKDGATELLLFFVDHGNQYSFYLNPKETLSASNLVDQIIDIADRVDEKIIFIYDACYSGSFLSETKDETILADKLITITSTDPNQTAYFLNQGMVSFSYPFFDEWFLTHSLLDAFYYASESLPLTGQTPCIYDCNSIKAWDRQKIYYVDESRPVIDDVEAYREEGKLYITAQVNSLIGISKVWAIVESTQYAQTSSFGKAVTEAPELQLIFYPDPNDLFSDPNKFGGGYELIAPDPCPNETSYILNIYALDKSNRPKTASYKVAIGDTIENRTMALIIAGSPEYFSLEKRDERNKLEAQIERAKTILESKGLMQNEIKNFSDINNPEDITSLTNAQILFIYLIGGVRLQENGSPYFYLNPNECLTPSEFSELLPQDPNQHRLILMDAPYAERFLKAAIDPNNWPERWAGIASTDKGHLFFSIEDDVYFSKKLFPCFSSFFFSALLSGATIAQAYRMAENAVSLTRQNPCLFLSEQIEDYRTLNQHLGYYIGISAIPGEDFSLFIDCNAEVKEENGTGHYKTYTLSLTLHPEADTNTNAWAILTSSPSSFYQHSMIVDLEPNCPQEGMNDYTSYCKDVSSGQEYYKAYFMIEGQTKGQSDVKRTEWQEVPIVHPSINIGEDDFEPDDNPNTILIDPNHDIINAPPVMRTFYYPDYIYGEGCNDIDREFFYAIQDHTYEIYAQDLSEYGYFIQLCICDSDTDLNNRDCLLANNYLSFTCKESGYYLIEARLASSYPQKSGVKYILSVCNPQADDITGIVGRVVDTNGRGVNSLIVQIKEYSRECSSVTENIYYDSNFPPQGYFYIPDIPASLTSLNLISLEVCAYDNPKNVLATKSLKPPDPYNLDHTLVYSPIVLESVPKILETIYDIKISEIKNFLNICPNCVHVLPLGDKDSSFPMEGDYDGDGFSNQDEILSCLTPPYLLTVPLNLSKGMNIYHFPYISDIPNISTESLAPSKLYYYDPDLDPDLESCWKEIELRFEPNHFNAIHTSAQGILYLNLTSSEPILYLKGFLNQDGSPPDCSNSADCLFNPDLFEPNVSSLSILENSKLKNIQTISGQNSKNGKWESSYRFFGKLMREDICIEPHVVYDVTKGTEGNKK